VTGIQVRLSADHYGLPAGTEVMVGYAEAGAKYTPAPAVAPKPKPQRQTKPSKHKKKQPKTGAGVGPARRSRTSLFVLRPTSRRA
jgi:hypothetical protein